LASGTLAVIVPAPPAIRTPGDDKAGPRTVIALARCTILRRRETAVKGRDVAADQCVPPLGKPLGRSAIASWASISPATTALVEQLSPLTMSGAGGGTRASLRVLGASGIGRTDLS